MIRQQRDAQERVLGLRESNMAIKATVKGDKLTLEIDLEAGEPSDSNKTMILYTSHGQRELDVKDKDGHQLLGGINIGYRIKKKS
jgi:hypothetical protein